MNISNLFFEAAKRHPNKLAIIDNKRSVTFSELSHEVKRTAAYFHSKGIQKHDRVLVFVPMSLDLYRIVLAIFSIGATAVFIDEWSNKDRIRQSSKLAQCKGLVGSRKIRFLSYLFSETRAIPLKLSSKKMSVDQHPTEDMSGKDSALITFTTGSTGLPKAADRSHEFLGVQFEILKKEINPKSDEVDLVNLPIVLFVNLAAGCTSVIPTYSSKQPLKTKWNLILDQISSYGVNRITGSPYFTYGLADFLKQSNKKNTDIHKIFTGGGPVFADEAAEMISAFPNSEITIVYGATEVEPISLIKGAELVKFQESEKRGLPVGKPHDSIDLRIFQIDTPFSKDLSEIDFDKLCLNENEIGEIIVAGKPVLHSYFNTQKDLKGLKIRTEKTIWHRTGDSGFLKNGKLYLTGRSSEVIAHDDKRYSLFMIENELKKNPNIKYGTLIQVNDKNILCIEMKNNVEIKKTIFDFPVDQVKVFDSLPKDPRHNTKIDYKLLRQLINDNISN